MRICFTFRTGVRHSWPILTVRRALSASPRQVNARAVGGKRPQLARARHQLRGARADNRPTFIRRVRRGQVSPDAGRDAAGLVSGRPCETVCTVIGGGTPDSTTRTRNANATSTTSSSYTVEEKGKSGVSSNSGVLNKNACRKRTSSGVFEVDDAEPVSKKPEPALKPVERGGRRRGADADSPSGADRPRTPRSKTEAVPNGVRKRAEERDDSDSAASKSDNSDVSPEKKVIARFEKSYNATQCVSAFKESDTWD
ncbi:hypothetical protein EVAR_28439_1 [Eumeta japonica]|uniref:Uncharacterized protein n=1 Tax=Eumeta variegata TaxID=151549 RepID=A0A4C1VAK5_EUMVA|nr:hypothetical protein EVAR_28439_1 [Eumeta japonica]